MSLSHAILKNTTALTIGKIFSTAMGVITIALLLRYLSPDDYGRYTTVLSFVLLFGTFVDFGLNLTTTQDISLPNTNTEKTLSSIVTLRVLINIGLLLILPLIIWVFPYELVVKQAIIITSLLFFSQSLIQVLSSYFQKELRAYTVAFADIVGRIVLVVSTVWAIYLQFSFLYIMFTVVLSALIHVWILLRATSRSIQLRWSIDIAIWKRIIAKTWPIALSVIFTTIYFKGDAVILSLVRPYEDVGVYGAAYKVLEVLIALPIMFMGLILPHLTKAYAEKNAQHFQRAIQKTWDALTLITLPMVAGTIVLAHPIMRLIAGEGYTDSPRVLQILIVAAGIIFLGSLFTHAVVAVEKQKSMIKIYALAAVLAGVLYVYFIPIYTYFAAALVTVGAELLIACAAYVVVKKAQSFTLQTSIFIKTAISSICMAGALWYLPEWSLLYTIPIGTTVYLLVLLLLRVPLFSYIKST